MFCPGPGLQPSSSMLKRRRALANRMFEETDMLMRKQREQRFGFSKPRYEVVDDNNVFQLSIDVPGIKPEDISISLEDGYLNVRGQRSATGDNSQFSSKFSQTFSLDPAIDLDGFKANLENGVLIISAPKDMKKLEENIRRIPIETSTPEDEEIPTNMAVEGVEKEPEEPKQDNDLEITEDNGEPETEA